MPPPLSQRLADFHRYQVTYHRRMARDHGYDGAALRHQKAAEAHELVMATPLDEKTAAAAMRASAIVDEASQRAGVRPLLPWPAPKPPPRD